MKAFVRYCIYAVGSITLAVANFLASSYFCSGYVANYDYRLTTGPAESDFGRPVVVAAANPRRVRILAIEGGALFGLPIWKC